jgi:hypothetical protein
LVVQTGHWLQKPIHALRGLHASRAHHEASVRAGPATARLDYALLVGLDVFVFLVHFFVFIVIVIELVGFFIVRAIGDALVTSRNAGPAVASIARW